MDLGKNGTLTHFRQLIAFKLEITKPGTAVNLSRM